MKSLYLRSGLALACALSLSACGGGSGTLLLSGAVVGLTKDGLVLENNGKFLPVPALATYFQFPDLLSNDEGFEIKVSSQPANGKATCTVLNGKGTTGSFNPINIVVSCTTVSYDLTGHVTGLDKDLVIVNGSNQVTIPAGAASFSMTHLDAAGKPASGQVADGAPYGLAVLAQPEGRTCSITNGSGIMNGPVTNVEIKCDKNPGAI